MFINAEMSDGSTDGLSSSCTASVLLVMAAGTVDAGGCGAYGARSDSAKWRVTLT